MTKQKEKALISFKKAKSLTEKIIKMIEEEIAKRTIEVKEIKNLMIITGVVLITAFLI